MEGRYPNGLLLALTNCNDASKGDEYARWYNHIHFPDVTASAIFKHPIRFADTDPTRLAASMPPPMRQTTKMLPSPCQTIEKLRPNCHLTMVEAQS